MKKTAQKLLKDFQKMDNWVKYLIGAAVVFLLLSLFWPRGRQTGVKLVPVPGTSYYRAVFEGFDEGEGVAEAMSNGRPCVAVFYAPWCGFCKQLKPHWQKFAGSRQGKDYNIVSVDCTVHKDLAKKHSITGYPTIKYLPGGLADPSGAVDYDGDRTESGLAAFLSRYHQ